MLRERESEEEGGMKRAIDTKDGNWDVCFIIERASAPELNCEKVFFRAASSLNQLEFVVCELLREQTVSIDENKWNSLSSR